MTAFTVRSIRAAEILDSRGNPTVACELQLQDGATGFMQVPSGASTGQYEATELRDADVSRYFGKGVQTVIRALEHEISAAVRSRAFDTFAAFDAALCALDGTAQKSRLGANALLAASGAFVRAAAASSRQPLFAYLSQSSMSLPVPFMNVINGGRHADNQLAIQEFMLVPHGFDRFKEAVHAGAVITKRLGEICQKRYGRAGRGDEGGFAPEVSDARQALDAIMEAIELSGYTRGQVGIALDLAASEYCGEGQYWCDKLGQQVCDQGQWVHYLQTLVRDYPIVSLEDVASDVDIGTWQAVTSAIPSGVQIVGDDVFVTQKDRLQHGIEQGVANAILLKPNQVGTISEVVATARFAQENHYGTVMSHRSGETEDAIIADLAVALGCRQIKTGPLRQSDRLSKYNRLLWIEKLLGDRARFPTNFFQASRDKKAVF